MRDGPLPLPATRPTTPDVDALIVSVEDFGDGSGLASTAILNPRGRSRLLRLRSSVSLMRSGQLSNPKIIDGWHSMLSAGRMRSVPSLARGIVARKADDLDSNPDLLNTPGGIVDLRTGDLIAHDPSLLITRITSGSYRPGFTHPDWERALQALPETERSWFQARHRRYKPPAGRSLRW